MALSKKHVNEVCKVWQGEDTCRYLSMSVPDCQCLKLTPFRQRIDERVAAGNFSAKGDNCEGKSPPGFDPKPTAN